MTLPLTASVLCLRCLARTREPIRTHDIAAEILSRSRSIALLKVHVSNTNAIARRRARALHASHNIRLQRPTHVANGQIAYLKLRRITLPRKPRVRITLRHVKGLQGVGDREVAYGHVAEVA